MSICWKDKEKQIFCLNFFKVICYWYNIWIQIMFLWDMLGQAMLFKGMRTKFKKILTNLSFYLSFLPLYFLNQTLSLQYQYFFGRIWTAWDYHQKIVLCMRIKGMYGFTCVLLRLGPLFDGQSRLGCKKKEVVVR